MFDAMEKVWLGERRGEKLAGWFGSVALHAVLLGWALMPRSVPKPKPAPPVEVIDLVFPTTAPKPFPAFNGGFRLPPFPFPGVPEIATDPVPFEAAPSVLPWSPEGAWWKVATWAATGREYGSPGTVTEVAIDDPPEVLSTPAVRYPALLRDAGIEGSVVLEFVVDTTGRVEPATIRIISSTQTLFEAPAREAIMKSLYRAGRWRGSPVRALALERVAFTIAR